MSGHEHAGLIGPAQETQIAAHLDLTCLPWRGSGSPLDHPELDEVEVVFFSGGTAGLDRSLLDRLPRLRALFVAGDPTLPDSHPEDLSRRKIRVSSVDAIYRTTFADFAIGAILFGLKHGFRHAAHARQYGYHSAKHLVPGTFESTVGLSSLGASGRALLRRLRKFDLNVIVHDPALSPEEARRLDIESVRLEELFQRADAISLHTPDSHFSPELIRGQHFAAMKPGAVLINTAEPGLVQDDEMIRELAARPDLTAVLDSMDASAAVPGQPVSGMPNVFLTPQIVSGRQRDLRWVGQCMIDEYFRWARGQSMLGELTQGRAVPRS